MDVDALIAQLGLEPHPLEGGYFRRTFTHPEHTLTAQGERHMASAIYYLLTRQAPRGRLHVNHSTIIHAFHGGAPLRYYLVEKDKLAIHTLGMDLANGQQPQLLVPGGVWKATELLEGEKPWGLVSEVVVPGFDYQDNHLVAATEVHQQCPRLLKQLVPFLD